MAAGLLGFAFVGGFGSGMSSGIATAQRMSSIRKQVCAAKSSMQALVTSAQCIAADGKAKGKQYKCLWDTMQNVVAQHRGILKQRHQEYGAHLARVNAFGIFFVSLVASIMFLKCINVHMQDFTEWVRTVANYPRQTADFEVRQTVAGETQVTTLRNMWIEKRSLAQRLREYFTTSKGFMECLVVNGSVYGTMFVVASAYVIFATFVLLRKRDLCGPDNVYQSGICQPSETDSNFLPRSLWDIGNKIYWNKILGVPCKDMSPQSCPSG